MLTEKTVRNYVWRVIAKLKAGHRAEAVVLAWEAGLAAPCGEPGPPAQLLLAGPDGQHPAEACRDPALTRTTAPAGQWLRIHGRPEAWVTTRAPVPRTSAACSAGPAARSMSARTRNCTSPPVRILPASAARKPEHGRTGFPAAPVNALPGDSERSEEPLREVPVEVESTTESQLFEVTDFRQCRGLVDVVQVRHVAPFSMRGNGYQKFARYPSVLMLPQ